MSNGQHKQGSKHRTRASAVENQKSSDADAVTAKCPSLKTLGILA